MLGSLGLGVLTRCGTVGGSRPRCPRSGWDIRRACLSPPAGHLAAPPIRLGCPRAKCSAGAGPAPRAGVAPCHPGAAISSRGAVCVSGLRCFCRSAVRRIPDPSPGSPPPGDALAQGGGGTTPRSPGSLIGRPPAGVRGLWSRPSGHRATGRSVWDHLVESQRDTGWVRTGRRAGLGRSGFQVGGLRVSRRPPRPAAHLLIRARPVSSAGRVPRLRSCSRPGRRPCGVLWRYGGTRIRRQSSSGQAGTGVRHQVQWRVRRRWTPRAVLLGASYGTP